MSAYGQVYWGCYMAGEGWRGILMNQSHAEVWRGRCAQHPDEAFAEMVAEAPAHDITDLRRWSGTVTPEELEEIRTRNEARKKAEAEAAERAAKKGQKSAA